MLIGSDFSFAGHPSHRLRVAEKLLSFGPQPERLAALGPPFLRWPSGAREACARWLFGQTGQLRPLPCTVSNSVVLVKRLTSGTAQRLKLIRTLISGCYMCISDVANSSGVRLPRLESRGDKFGPQASDMLQSVSSIHIYMARYHNEG
jgi:hypothetical protein